MAVNYLQVPTPKSVNCRGATMKVKLILNYTTLTRSEPVQAQRKTKESYWITKLNIPILEILTGTVQFPESPK